MIVLGRHRALTHDAWSELAVRAAIEEIAADAIAHFHPDTFWPAHPSDDGVGDGNTSFYVGAAGVIWALDYLHRIGATRAAKDTKGKTTMSRDWHMEWDLLKQVDINSANEIDKEAQAAGDQAR